jgi:septal ring factor EnvC (AmiA/AmiB activator)
MYTFLSFQVRFFSTISFISIKMQLSFIFVLAAIASSSLAAPLPGQAWTSNMSVQQQQMTNQLAHLKTQVNQIQTQQAQLTQSRNSKYQNVNQAARKLWSRHQRRSDDDIFRRQEEIDNFSIE